MKSGNVGAGNKMPYHQNNRKPPSHNAPDGEYFDTVDKYTPSKPVPGFYEGNNSRTTDPSVSWGGGGGYDSGGSAMFMG